LKTKKDVEEECHDHLVVGSITDKKKDAYLPYNMKSNFLTDCYESKIIPFGKMARWCSREYDSSLGNVKDNLWQLADFEKVEIITVGNHGRKGPKADETVCGTAIEYLAMN
jgi:hypothetical protein